MSFSPSASNTGGGAVHVVVPLTPTSGVVEWVERTLPVGEWLVGRRDPKAGAHARYRPGDMLTNECRAKLKAAGGPPAAPTPPEAPPPHDTVGGVAEERIRAFAEICERFTPVMHHFFLEQWPVAEEWLRNILMDTETGEVVHIDIGVAFERGKQLPVPELQQEWAEWQQDRAGLGASLPQSKKKREAKEQEGKRNQDAELALAKYLSVAGQTQMLIKQASSLDVL
eukprot:gene14162-11009_t